MKINFAPVRTVPVLVIALLAGMTAYTQDKTGEIDKIFSWATPATPGCACVVAQHGKVIVNRAYGSADLERDVPINPGTVFDAGSLQKQFVAAAVLLLVEEGRLSLTDDVRKYIPELPDYGHKITINHLMTHTSGIRDWTGMLLLASGNPDAWSMILRQRGLQSIPGEEWSYSSSGFVLLKEIVARVSGMPFGEFARKRLFEPLGMKATTYREDMRDVIRNRALAYDKVKGNWRMAMMLDNDRGGGALLSTAGDLIIWNEALTNARLGTFVSEKIQEPSRLNNGRQLDYARGLILDRYRGAREVWHSGSADGYKSWLGRYPEQSLSIAIMCNSGDDTDRRTFARRIFDLLVSDTSALKAPFNPLPPVSDVAGLDLNSKAGLYFNERNGDPLRLVVFRDRLRVDDGPGFVAVTKDRFKRWGALTQFMSQDEFELQFISNDLVELKTMEGNITRYRRARPYTPTAAELKAYTGRFESDEMRAVFQVEAGKDALVIRLEHAPAKYLEFKPVERDIFQGGRMMARFLRNKSGKVVAFEYSNPAMRNIKFVRLHNQ